MASPAELVRAARKAAGLTQRGLALRASTSAAAVNRYERGRMVPDLATLERVLAACGFELRLAMAPLPSGPLKPDTAAPDQDEVDRRAIATALDEAQGRGWVRPPAARPSPRGSR